MNNTELWHSLYPPGVDYEINPRKYKNLNELFDYALEHYGEQNFFSSMSRSLTFNEVDKYASQFAAYLQSIGLEKGDKIVLQMPNILQYPVAAIGALRAGLILVNTNPLYTPREMEHQYKNSQAKAVVILSNFAHNLEKILPSTDIQHIIITDIGDMLGTVKGAVTNLVVKYVRRMVPSYSIKNAINFKKCLSLGSKYKFQQVDVENQDTALIQYTGGTTGISKGAELSHANIISNVEGINQWFQPIANNDLPRIVLGALPLYHIFALTLNLFSGMKLGFHNNLVINPRDQKSLLKELSKYKYFIIPGLNTLFNALNENPEFAKLNFTNLRVTIAGGMSLQSHVANRWEKITGCKITEGYGLSETSPVVSCNPVTDQHIGTVGIPFPSTDIRIWDGNREWLPRGEEGEICVCGPQVMKAYFNNKEETTNAFIIDENGNKYFKTGDIGVIQEDGFIKIVDRIKDMINVSGFNVFPNEIEEVISSMPGVLESAVIGIPDEKSNEAVKIFVVKSDPAISEQDIRNFSKENLTNYKRPKYIEFTDSLPKNNIGKIIRRFLKPELNTESK